MAVKGVTEDSASLTMEASATPLEKSELERLVANMPVGLLVEDEGGRILWVNKTFVSFVGKTSEQLHGTRVNDLPVIRVPGVGANPDFCQIEGPRTEGPEWLLCSWQRISHTNGKGLIARFYLDATDHRRVQRLRGHQLLPQHGASGVTDQVTGALDRAAIMQVLETEVSRSRRYHNPLAVIRLRLEIPVTDVQNDAIARFMSVTARALREQTRWVDRIGRWSEKEFLLVLPESNASAAGSLAEKLQRHVAERQACDPEDDSSQSMVRCGIAEWQRGDDVLKLLERVRAGLEVAGD